LGSFGLFGSFGLRADEHVYYRASLETAHLGDPAIRAPSAARRFDSGEHHAIFTNDAPGLSRVTE